MALLFRILLGEIEGQGPCQELLRLQQIWVSRALSKIDSSWPPVALLSPQGRVCLCRVPPELQGIPLEQRSCISSLQTTRFGNAYKQETGSHPAEPGLKDLGCTQKWCRGAWKGAGEPGRVWVLCFLLPRSPASQRRSICSPSSRFPSRDGDAKLVDHSFQWSIGYWEGILRVRRPWHSFPRENPGETWSSGRRWGLEQMIFRTPSNTDSGIP